MLNNFVSNLTNHLEVQVKQLQKENGSLVLLSQRLRQSVQTLESQINFHVRSGCQVTIQHNDEVKNEMSQKPICR
jgi:hypothetical protein